MERSVATSGAVYDDTLSYQQDGQEITLAVASSEWYRWLEHATSFTFRSAEGMFTAHKERASNHRGGWYWRAYRQRHGQLQRFYLGVSARVTAERLRSAAYRLAHAKHPAHEDKTNLAPTRTSPATAAILVTKLQIPRLPMQHVPRLQVVELLEQCAQRPLTLVCAPAGSGKTTLLTEWANSTALPIAWIALEAAENDPARFLAYLLTALAGLDNHPGATMQPPQSPYTLDHERVLTSVLNDLASHLQQDAALILDDYHLMTSEAVHAALQFLLDHLPTRLHLIIGTRSDPPLPLARLRAHYQLSELRTPELRFVTTEVAAFVSVMGFTLSNETQLLLEQQTEGWIAGVQLLVLALRGQADPAAFLRAFRGNHRFLLDYVSEEILTQQTPEMQHFLLRTCILERLSGPLCDFVTEQADGQVRLRELLRVNLFVSALDDTDTCYRYHPLFAEALRAHLHKQEPGLVPELYRRASCWYEQQQGMEEACEYAFLAADLPRAANLLAALFPYLMEQGKLARLKRWLDQLPAALIAASPQLCIASLWMQLQHRHTSVNIEEVIAPMERRIQELPQDAAMAWMELQSELTMLQAFTAFSQNDLPRTIELLQAALQVLPVNKTALSQLISLQLRVFLSMAYRSSGDFPAAEQTLLAISAPHPPEPYHMLNLVAAWLLAELYEAQGQLRKRGQLYESIFQVLKPHTDLPSMPLVLGYVSRATLFYEWNRLPEAAHAMQQALSVARLVDNISPDTNFIYGAFTTLSFWIQARIELAQGHYELVRQELQQEKQHIPAEPPQHKGPTVQHTNYVVTVQARLALACHQIEKAQRWQETYGIHLADVSGIQLDNRYYFDYMTQARLLIAQGRTQRPALLSALRLLDSLRDSVVRIGLHGWFIETQMLTALALQAQGKTRQALTTLGPVLAQAEPEGYVRLFADEGQPMAQLLTQVTAYTTASSDYLQILLAAILPIQNEDLPQAVTQQSLLDPLSAREQEVLHLLAAGSSNQHIADQLVISLHTVKLHVKHILAKLGVTSRTQAAARARELNLL